MKIKDVAEKAGVSITSVSKALSGNSDLSAETVERIRKIANELGYVPNANARSLKTNRTYNIGILFVDKMNSGLKHEYFSAILDSLKVEAEKEGFDITFISNNLGSRHLTFLQHTQYRNCDGVIIACVDFKDPQVLELVESGIPVVTIDYSYDSITSILSDNYKGLEEITDYCCKLGHERIAFIHGEDTSVTQKRLASFYKSCERNGIEVPDEYIIAAQYHNPKLSGLATRDLLALNNPPTCIIYPDDYSLLGGMTEIEKHGLSIGKDISIVGYDGISLSQLLRPKLTTYKQNSEEIGRLAAQKLIERINNPKTSIPEQLSVVGEMLVGSTVKDLTGN